MYETVAVVMPDVMGKNLATYGEECISALHFVALTLVQEDNDAIAKIHAFSPLATLSPASCGNVILHIQGLDQLHKDSSHPLFDPQFEEWMHVVCDRVTLWPSPALSSC